MPGVCFAIYATTAPRLKKRFCNNNNYEVTRRGFVTIIIVTSFANTLPGMALYAPAFTIN